MIGFQEARVKAKRLLMTQCQKSHDAGAHHFLWVIQGQLRFSAGVYLIRRGNREMWFVRGPSLETGYYTGGVQNGPKVG